MARTNDFKRAELLKQRVEEYDAAGLSGHRNAKFAQDMIDRTQLGRGFTAGQRKWVESIINEPIPTARDQALYDQILSASETKGLKRRSKEILLEFSIKAFNGWSFSEKQNAFLTSLLEEAGEVSLNGPWLPSPEQITDLHTCMKLSRRYHHSGYLSSHPGLQKALIVTEHFLGWTEKYGNDAGSVTESGLSEWHVNKVLKQFKTPLAELASPKHPAGETRYIKTMGPDMFMIHHIALIIDDPIVSDKGQIVYPVIVNGGLEHVLGEALKKRGPRSMRS